MSLKYGSDRLRKGKKDTFVFLLCFYASWKNTLHVQSNLLECDVSAPCFLCCKLRWGRINQHIWCTHSLSKLNRCLKPSPLTETGTSLLLGKTVFYTNNMASTSEHFYLWISEFFCSVHLNWWTILWITATLNDEEVKQSFDRVLSQKVYTN